MIASDVNTTAAQSIGVMIDMEFLGYESQDFIETMCPHQESPQHVSAEWRDPSSQPPSREMIFPHCSTKLRGNVVHLFVFPSAFQRDFFLGELRFPMGLDGLGFVVIVNLRSLSRFSHSERSRFWTKNRASIRSALVWALAHEVPLVVVAFYDDTPIPFSTEELQAIFELSADVPIYHCSSDFDRQVVHEVLGILLEQFEAS